MTKVTEQIVETIFVGILCVVFVVAMWNKTTNATETRRKCQEQGGVVTSSPLTWGADLKCVID